MPMFFKLCQLFHINVHSIHSSNSSTAMLILGMDYKRKWGHFYWQLDCQHHNESEYYQGIWTLERIWFQWVLTWLVTYRKMDGCVSRCSNHDKWNKYSKVANVQWFLYKFIIWSSWSSLVFIKKSISTWNIHKIPFWLQTISFAIVYLWRSIILFFWLFIPCILSLSFFLLRVI